MPISLLDCRYRLMSCPQGHNTSQTGAALKIVNREVLQTNAAFIRIHLEREAWKNVVFHLCWSLHWHHGPAAAWSSHNWPHVQRTWGESIQSPAVSPRLLLTERDESDSWGIFNHVCKRVSRTAGDHSDQAERQTFSFFPHCLIGLSKSSSCWLGLLLFEWTPAHKYRFVEILRTRSPQTYMDFFENLKGTSSFKT